MNNLIEKILKIVFIILSFILMFFAYKILRLDTKDWNGGMTIEIQYENNVPLKDIKYILSKSNKYKKSTVIKKIK